MANALRLGYCAMRQRLEDRDRPVTETYVLADDYDALAARLAVVEPALRRFLEAQSPHELGCGCWVCKTRAVIGRASASPSGEPVQ